MGAHRKVENGNAMKGLVVGGAISLGIWAALLTPLALVWQDDVTASRSPGLAAVERIEEDDPLGRWDCATMGNKICGPMVGSPAEGAN